MALSTEQIDTLLASAAGLIDQGKSIDDVARALREMMPDRMTVTGVHADSMSEDPFKTQGRAAVYLVDNSEHCWVLTGDPARANGLVVGWMDEED